MEKKLDIEEFLRLLSETPRTWRLTDEDKIRDGEGYCPLQVVTKRAFGYISESKSMGLTDAETDFIIAAADGYNVLETVDLREELLKACGLDKRAS
jgi:hypothetical protein